MLKIIEKAVFLCCILSLICVPSTLATDKQVADDSKAKQTVLNYGLVDNSLFDEETVTRGDCVIAIMKATGETEEMARCWRERMYSSTITECEGDLFSGAGHFPYERYKYNGYLIGAFFNRVLLGDPYHYTNVMPARAVTAQEVAAFMVRCVDNTLDENDLYQTIYQIGQKSTYQTAKEKGLILPTDRFYDNRKLTVTPDEFCVLLQRMLYQPRYRYFGDLVIGDENYGFMQCDKVGDKPYIDYLTKIAK